MIEVEGMEGIKAKVLKDSKSVISGKRITTFELELPRFIWCECLTHRMFSRNAASSRAIPIKKKRKHILKDPAMPVYWGKNKSGMQAAEELKGIRLSLAKKTWSFGSKVACGLSWLFEKVGLHKQLSNRALEPFERYKVVITATEFENWFWLRDHEDAQPEIRELARVMSEAMKISTPQDLYNSEWHLPYVETIRNADGTFEYIVNNKVIDLETAKKVSASCCAQISYRLLNQSVETAKKIYDKLITSEPKHSSPFEHQATPMKIRDSFAYQVSKKDFEAGITHIKLGSDIETCNLWSGNFCGWVQYRQLI